MMHWQVRRPARGQTVAAAQKQRTPQRSRRPRQTHRQRRNQTAQAGLHHGAVMSAFSGTNAIHAICQWLKPEACA